MKVSAQAVALVAALLFVTAAGAADAPSQTGTPSGYAQHLAELINRYRQEHGLAPLATTNYLASIASEHTVQMADARRLSHDGFRERFARTHARICVENVGWNFPFPEAQLDGWRASPGHHRNLLEPKVTQMGVAVSRAYVTFFACS